MKQQVRNIVMAAAVCGAAVSVAVSAQSRAAVKSPNGITLAEFSGYESWPVIAPSQPDNAGGCGVAKDGCIKSILGNAAMIKAYADGFGANGKSVPDGARMAKVEWHRTQVAAPPYGVGVPGELAGISVMVKDSKRFPETNGWGYATFVYNAEGDSFKPSTEDPAVMRTTCHSCHTRYAKARDYVFTQYAKR